MPKRKLGAKPHTRFIPREIPEIKKPNRKTDQCPHCHRIKTRVAKMCRFCEKTRFRPPIDPRVYIIEGVRCRRIPLRGGDDKQYTIVDASDYRYLIQFRWNLAVTWDGQRYAVASIFDRERGSFRQIRMHRMIMGVVDDPKTQVDHRNGNGLHNRRKNIRVATPTQNTCNQKRSSKNVSGYKGVSRDKERGLWYACISIHRVRINCGRYQNKKKAAMVYDAAARYLFGKFARLNFPNINASPKGLNPILRRKMEKILRGHAYPL